jgi:hypothetical protein
VSNTTLAPVVADVAIESAVRDDDPTTLTQRQIDAESALLNLERLVRRLDRQVNPESPLPRTIPRRSRRSAWVDVQRML